jgi:hypothetical protein
MASITPEIEQLCKKILVMLNTNKIRVFRYTRNKNMKRKTYNLEVEMIDDEPESEFRFGFSIPSGNEIKNE